MKPMTHNDLGEFSLTDRCGKVCIKTLLHQVRKRLKLELLKSSLEVAGYEVDLILSKTGNGGERYWFACPICKQRCGVLYRHPISLGVGCRGCLRLRYRKSAKKGMIEGLLNP